MNELAIVHKQVKNKLLVLVDQKQDKKKYKKPCSNLGLLCKWEGKCSSCSCFSLLLLSKKLKASSGKTK